MKAKYAIAIMAALILTGTVLAQSINPLLQVSAITSGLQGILIIIGIISLIIGIILLVVGIKVGSRTYPAQKGKRFKGMVLTALGVLILIFGIFALVGAAVLPGVVNSIVNPNNLNLSTYQSVVNSCIGISQISCSKPILSYVNSTGLIVFTLTQSTPSNWTSATLEFVNQTQEGVESSQGFDYAIPYWTASNGMPSGKPINVVLPFAQYVKQGAPMLGYVWVVYTVPNDSNPKTEQIATIAVS